MEPVYLLLPICGAFLFLLLGCCFGKKMKEMLHIPKEVILGRQLVEQAGGELAEQTESESDWEEGPSIRIVVRGGRGRTRPLDTGQPVVPLGHHMGVMAWGEDSGISTEPSSSQVYQNGSPSGENYYHHHHHHHISQVPARHSGYMGSSSQVSSPDSSPCQSPSRTLRSHTLTLGVRHSPTQDSSNCVELAPLTRQSLQDDIPSDLDLDLNYDDYIMDDDDDDDSDDNYDDNNNNEHDDENNNLASIVIHHTGHSVCECSTSSGVVTMATTDTEDYPDNSIDIVTDLPSSPDEGFQENLLEDNDLNDLDDSDLEQFKDSPNLKETHEANKAITRVPENTLPQGGDIPDSSSAPQRLNIIGNIPDTVQEDGSKLNENTTNPDFVAKSPPEVNISSEDIHFDVTISVIPSSPNAQNDKESYKETIASPQRQVNDTMEEVPSSNNKDMCILPHASIQGQLVSENGNDLIIQKDVKENNSKCSPQPT